MYAGHIEGTKCLPEGASTQIIGFLVLSTISLNVVFESLDT